MEERKFLRGICGSVNANGIWRRTKWELIEIYCESRITIMPDLKVKRLFLERERKYFRRMDGVVKLNGILRRMKREI